MPDSDSGLTPEQRTLRARLGAHALHAQGKTTTEAAREAFDRRFLDEVDPDRKLPVDERLRRAQYARKAYFTRLALKSARARARKAAGDAA